MGFILSLLFFLILGSDSLDSPHIVNIWLLFQETFSGVSQTSARSPLFVNHGSFALTLSLYIHGNLCFCFFLISGHFHDDDTYVFILRTTASILYFWQ